MKKKELISRIIVFLLLVIVITPLFITYNWNRYNNGTNLTKNEYINDFARHRKELLDSKKGTNFAYSLTVTFIGMLIIVGGYELIVFAVKTLIFSSKNSTARRRGT